MLPTKPGSVYKQLPHCVAPDQADPNVLVSGMDDLPTPPHAGSDRESTFQEFKQDPEGKSTETDLIIRI